MSQLEARVGGQDVFHGEKSPTVQQLGLLSKDLYRFVAMFLVMEPEMRRGINAGGHILAIGDGDGSPAVPFLLVAGDGTRYLQTDVLDYGEARLSYPDIWRWYYTQGEASGWEVPDPFRRGEVVMLNRESWKAADSRIIQAFGPSWDATDITIFDRAREMLGGNLGVLILRHPEIGNPGRPDLTATFTRIIRNMLAEGVDKNIPVMITTSNNSLSWENIRRAVVGFFEALDYASETVSGGDYMDVHDVGMRFEKDGVVVDANWDFEPYDRKVALPLGPRTLDYKILRIFRSE